MRARAQGSDQLLVEAPPERLWDIVEDRSQLPRWVPMVQTVTPADDREEAGAVRRCEVSVGRRDGYVVERCIEAIPNRKLVHAIEDDSLGFTKMFADYAFALQLEPWPSGGTLVTCEAFYEPRAPLTRVLNALVMRRRFRGMRRRILLGLKQLAEADPAPESG